MIENKIAQLIDQNKDEECLSQIIADFLQDQRVSGHIYNFTVYQVIERTGVKLVVDIQAEKDSNISSFFYKI